MKLTKYFSLVSFLVIVQFILFNSGFRSGISIQSASADDSWKNFYAIAWDGSGTESARYAKQMGYDYIAIKTNEKVSNYNTSAFSGLKFYILDPNKWWKTVFSNNSGQIDTTKTYTSEQQAWYEQRMVWKSYDTFPNNLASGPFGGTSTKFQPMWDFQQQSVIDEVVEKAITLFKSYENSQPFTFAGWMIDEPSINSDFKRWDTNNNREAHTALSYWTGSDSGLTHGTITHEYSAYQDGLAAFYKQLNTRMREEFPEARWIGEPSHLYHSNPSIANEYIYSIKDRSDKDEITPDMLFQENAGTATITNFVDDNRIYTSGVNITKGMVGSSQHSMVDEYKNRLIASKAGINGAWYNWFGSFMASAYLPDFKSITEVYPRLKLVRCIPGWDNLNGVPVDGSSRTWDESVYESYKDGDLQSYISSDVMYSRHPKTGKLFAVFNTTNGVITLNTGETVTDVQKVDGYFIEAGNASADFDISGSEIRIKSSVSIETDSSGNSKGKGYIFTVKTSGAPTATTGEATNVTSGSATLNGTVNGDGLSTTAWFEYGVVSGSYANTSSTQSVSGSVDTAVSIGISGLSAGTTYYYRIAAQNSAGTTYGNERSFTTPDTTGPSGAMTVNNNSSYANSTAVTLNLSATDDVGVTGYFLSNSNTAPSASSDGWTIITSAIAYSADVSYSLSGGNGKKTVYAWFKDAAGNVSSVASDSITLDTTAPTVTITNPTYNSTYTTTSSTINLGGDASDNASGISSVSWSNDQGGSGSTTNGATGWFISGISLSSGDNVITVTVTDGANNTGTDTITITYGAAPSVKTGSATHLTSNSATLNETINANGISTTVWFEYGVTSGTYSNTSSTQTVSGSADTTVSISITSLTSGKTYYYRVVAQNSIGTTYGAEKSFTTLDTTAPVSSIVIDGGASYAKSSAVTLSLSATDNVGVTGYYLSASATVPSASAAGWTPVTSAASHSAGVSYTLSSGDGSNTVYVWYKDAAGNVSDAASDSITLDTAAPAITITSPTSDSTYSTASGTLNLGGSTSDTDSGVSSVTWSSDKGGSGTADGTTNWSASGIALANGDNVITVTVTDGANNTASDVITVTYGASPSATTGSAANVTSNSATVAGTVNANYLSATVWFEYGITSGTYSNTSSTQTVSGSVNNTVNISITGLTSGKTYYYRVVAQNSIGTTYGAEKSFTTLDTTAPVSSIVIDGGASYAKSSAVTLSLSATDNVGVTGYYLSASATVPSASAAGWTPVTSAASHSAGVSYTLSSGDGSNTVYAWYKDAAGNVSDAASDSITLDTAAPVITITSPTSGSTYSTASGTLNLGGSASDATSGLAGITWSNSNGGSGAASGTSNWVISGISLSSGNNVITVIATDAVGNSSMASITVTYGAVPAATTGSVTGVASDSATVAGTVNANHLSTTVWFEYGATSGTYSNTSSTQTVSGSSDTTVSISITGLSSGKTYYYRIAAQNSAGTTYGSEKSFTTLDITAPACSIVINGGDAYTKSADVTLALSATDDVGVTGYYLSASDTTPTASANGWTSVAASVSYSGNVSYSLSSGDGSKTLYVWYKDAAGNVSTSANDAIMLDTAAPSIAITSPTSNTTYSATSSTLSLGGSASDTDSGVSSVTWSSDKGGSGTAIGTSNWSISDITLSTGDNVITVTATDEVGNSSTASITVTFNNDAGGSGSLQANYKFNEGSGTTAGDSSGKGKDGTISGAAWTTGKNGNGLSFNGTSDYVSVPTMNYEEISLSAWFYKNSNDTTNADAIFGGYKWTSDVQQQEGFDLKFHQSTPNILHFKVVTQDGNGNKTLKTNYKNLGNSVGNWYHVVGTYNKSTGAQKLYINGQLVATQTHPAGNTIVPLTSYADMRIGYSRVNNGYFKGKIDEVSLYNSALSDEEVQSLYNQ